MTFVVKLYAACIAVLATLQTKTARIAEAKECQVSLAVQFGLES